MSVPTYRVAISASGRTIVAIDRFAIVPDEITVLLGESGIGKSMISKAVYGLLDPDELTVTINGRPYGEYLGMVSTRELRRNSFFVFQEPSSHLNSLVKITDQLREGSLAGAGNEEEILRYLWQTTDDRAIQKVIDIYPKPYRPSGGEKQRVLLAMAFKKIARLIESKEPDTRTLFVFDEPTGSLNDNYRNRFLELLLESYRKRAFTILLITHDYSMISELYRSHGDLGKRIHYQELRREKDGHVALHEFSGERYLKWLQRKREHPAPRSEGETVLKVAPRVAVFGRRLGISSGESRATPAELLIRRGDMVYLKAPSGVGKTTLAKIVMGLYRAEELEMSLAGLAMTHRTPDREWRTSVWGKRAGMVFQHADEALDLQATVKETFTGLPIKPRPGTTRIRGWLRELFDGEIDEAFLSRKVARLSGGQKQRLNLLRTLAMSTDLVILDEPLNGLDFDSITKVLALLERKRREGAALLMISHNEEIFDALVEKRCVYRLRELQGATQDSRQSTVDSR